MTDAGESPTYAAGGAFVAAALELQARGLVPIPCGGANGKVRLIRWKQVTARASREELRRLLDNHRFRHANVGILTEPSGVVIVDCDGDDLLENAFALFGPTPLVTATPSGGHLAWYRASGERSRNLRTNGLAIDIKAAGGFVVVPPSKRPPGNRPGLAYRFVHGDLGDLPRLPRLRAGALEAFELPADGKLRRRATRRTVHEGQRNDTLFGRALRLARAADSLAELKATLHAENRDTCRPPLEPSEVDKTAPSAWRYECEDQNWAARPQFTAAHEVLDVMPGADAFFLLALLWRHHGARTEPFAIVADAMRAGGTVPGMSAKAITRARDALLAQGFLLRVHLGGRGPRDPSLYRLGHDPRLGLPKRTPMQ